VRLLTRPNDISQEESSQQRTGEDRHNTEAPSKSPECLLVNGCPNLPLRAQVQRRSLTNTSAASNSNLSGTTDNTKFPAIAARPPGPSNNNPISSAQGTSNVGEMAPSAIPAEEYYEEKPARSDAHQEGKFSATCGTKMCHSISTSTRPHN
jgi:hypothetical protein